MLTLLVLQPLCIVRTACRFSAGLAEVANAGSPVGEVQQFCNRRSRSSSSSSSGGQAR